jgi:hypothetical protein
MFLVNFQIDSSALDETYKCYTEILSQFLFWCHVTFNNKVTTQSKVIQPRSALMVTQQIYIISKRKKKPQWRK